MTTPNTNVGEANRFVYEFYTVDFNEVSRPDGEDRHPAMWAGLNDNGSLDYQDLETFPIFPLIATDPNEGGFGMTTPVEGHVWFEFRIDLPGYYGMVRLPGGWAHAMACELDPKYNAAPQMFEALEKCFDFISATDLPELHTEIRHVLYLARGEAHESRGESEMNTLVSDLAKCNVNNTPRGESEGGEGE